MFNTIVVITAIFLIVGALLLRLHQRGIAVLQARILRILSEEWQSHALILERLENEGQYCNGVVLASVMHDLEIQGFCEHRDRLLDISKELSLDLSVREYRLTTKRLRKRHNHQLPSGTLLAC